MDATSKFLQSEFKAGVLDDPARASRNGYQTKIHSEATSITMMQPGAEDSKGGETLEESDYGSIYSGVLNSGADFVNLEDGDAYSQVNFKTRCC